jgi:8-oxo-dGTP pyrophosphatase MutT (NUDIX family)
MAQPKTTQTKDGKPLHFSVGAIIQKDGKYLIIDRVRTPLGMATVAGHVDEGEDFETAIGREVKEEVGFDVVSYKKVFEEQLSLSECRHGVREHYWVMFECEIKGTISPDLKEIKSYGWYTPDEMKNIPLRQGDVYRLKKIGIL